MQPIVQMQMKGEPLPHQEEPKVEYQVQLPNGKSIMSTHDPEFARHYIERREKQHGDKVAKVSLVRVTTITERL